MKLLLLDDREENLLSLRAILNREDIIIYSTTSANEALRIVWENEIAVALVDVQMPGMDGFEFAEMLASNPKTRGILIVFVTAISKETTYAVKGLKTGAIDYLYKPLDPYITNAKVDSLIRLARSQQEIREKNHLLENYATIITNSPDIICTVDPESGTILSINPSVEKILGLPPTSLVNTPLLTLLIDPRHSGLQEVLVTKAYLGGETLVVEDQFNGKLHQPVWLELRITYKNRLLFINLHDIDKRKAHELALIEARSLADKSRKVKEAFLANMSHEIRTPLNGIIGLGNLLQATALDVQQKDLLDMLLQSSGSLLNILNDILDISKIEEGKFSILPVPVNLRTIGKGIVDLMKFKADEKRIELTIEVDNAVPESVMADGMRLNQILMNLVGNALKFTHTGFVRLRIEHTGKDGFLHKILIRVQDSGIGISEDRLSLIFTEYGQATKDTAHKYGGTGLGLTISQKLVELMGGKLNVRSERQVGSEFYFTLAVKDVNEPVPEVLPTLPFTQFPSLAGRKIVVAEDNKINSLLIKKYLTTWDVETYVVENGKEAVDLLRSSAFDMIIMDTRMPVMDGFEAARLIRNELKLTIPILSLSATVLEEDIRQALDSGMNDTLSKPFEPFRLYELIKVMTSARL